MRTNRGLYSDEERERRILKHEWGKDREKYYGRGVGDGEDGEGKWDVGVGVGGATRGLSSEDIWDQRKTVVKGAFSGDYWAAVREAQEVEMGEKEGGGSIR